MSRLTELADAEHRAAVHHQTTTTDDMGCAEYEQQMLLASTLSLEDLLPYLASPNSTIIYSGLVNINRLVSNGEDNETALGQITKALVANRGAVFPQLLSPAPTPTLPSRRIILEAVRLIEAIVSSSSCNLLIESDRHLIPQLVKLLDGFCSDNDHGDDNDIAVNLSIRHTVLTIIDSVLHKHRECCDKFINAGAISAIITKFILTVPSPKVLPLALDCLLRLLSGTTDDEPPAWTDSLLTLSILPALLISTDREVLSPALLLLRIITGRTHPLDESGDEVPDDDRIHAVITTPLLMPRLVHCITHSQTDQHLAIAVAVVGNLLLGEDSTTTLVLEAGVVEPLAKLVCHPRLKIAREAVWAISNVCGGTKEQAQMVIDSGVIKDMAKLYPKMKPEVQSECLWAVQNIESLSLPNISSYLVEQCGWIPVLVDALKDTQTNRKTSVQIINILTQFVVNDKDDGRIAKSLVDIGLPETLKTLSQSNGPQKSPALDMLKLLSAHDHGDQA